MRTWAEGSVPLGASMFWLVTCLLLSASFLPPVVGFPYRAPTLQRRQIIAPGPNDDWLRDTYLGEQSKTSPRISTYDREKFTIKTNSFLPNHYQAQAHISNGYFGTSLPVVYGGFERDSNLTGTHQPVQGWPEDQPRQTFAGIAGFYDNQEDTARTNFADIASVKNESVISGLPIWSHLQITTSDGHTLAVGVDNKTISEYERIRDFATNNVVTSLKWTPNPKDSSRWFKVKYTIFPHHVRFTLAVIQLEVQSSKKESITVTDILDGVGAVRSEFVKKGRDDEAGGIYTIVSPVGVPEVIGVEYSLVDFGKTTKVYKDSPVDATSKGYVSRNESSIAQEWTIQTQPGKLSTAVKYVGLASSDAFKGKEFATAKATAELAKIAGFKQLLKEQKRALEDFWGEDHLISIPGQPAFEAALRTSLAILVYSTRLEEEGPGINDWSIPVGGQSSDSYGGMVFWDSELWMLPGLVTSAPSHASTITNYRLKLVKQAAKNAKERNKAGLAYPWTSGRYGDCTGTGPCFDYQYHLNTDIGLSLWQTYCQTGNVTWLKEAWGTIKGVTDFMADNLHKNETTGGKYWMLNMTDPDEYANHIDNGAFTMTSIYKFTQIAQRVGKIIGEETPELWQDVVENIYIPYDADAGIIPEFTGMNGSVEIKQADVTLINYPIEFRLNVSQARKDSDFYGLAQSPDGPAMTWSISAINMAELEESGCSSYTYSLVACLSYIREPMWAWSEQVDDDFFTNGGTNPAFSFHTGAGGCLQTVMFGYGGKRFREDALYINPMLTRQLENGGIKYVDNYHGKHIEISIQAKETTVHRRFVLGDNPGEDPITIRLGNLKKDKELDFSLYPGQTLTFKTRRPDLEPPIIPGNVAQCVPVDSPQKYEPGKYPLAAVDGNNATYWQPLTTEPAYLDIDLGKAQPISGVSINWGAVPPKSFKLYTTGEILQLGNSTDLTAWTLVYGDSNVQISDPWDPIEALEVKVRTGNLTIANFEQAVESRFVRIEVEGTLNYEEPATLAELGIIAT